MQFNASGLACIAIALHTVTASAHHSFATFDTGREIVVKGIVKDFQWTNPHSWIMLTVERAGRVEQWSIELAGPSSLARQGWEPKTLTPGMPVTVIIHPLFDGTNGGQFVEITLRDGTVMGRSGTAAQ
jgi:Family of unknown function (DUF6152)